MRQPKNHSRHYQLDLDLEEMQLIRRMRQLRRNKQDHVILVRSRDCREVGQLPENTESRLSR